MSRPANFARHQQRTKVAAERAETMLSARGMHSVARAPQPMTSSAAAARKAANVARAKQIKRRLAIESLVQKRSER